MTEKNQPVKLSLSIPRKSENVSDVLRWWGVPETYLDVREGLCSGVYHSPAGWHGVVELPSLPEVYAKALKLASHRYAVTYLNALAQACVVSQYTVQESLSLTMHLMNLDFRNGVEQYRDSWQESWEPVLCVFQRISAPDVLNERPAGSRSMVQMMIQQLGVMVS
ncbi:hypothetical protein [Glutamicibacter ardleyensis]|uniref:hypothetical protein n=1 Tax=Glutamicibacter ardleyensis TaxID=225894 RepID=UPI003FD6728E